TATGRTRASGKERATTASTAFTLAGLVEPTATTMPDTVAAVLDGGDVNGVDIGPSALRTRVGHEQNRRLMYSGFDVSTSTVSMSAPVHPPPDLVACRFARLRAAGRPRPFARRQRGAFMAFPGNPQSGAAVVTRTAIGKTSERRGARGGSPSPGGELQRPGGSPDGCAPQALKEGA